MYQEIILYKVLWTISNFNIAKFGMRVPRLLYPWRRENFWQDKISRVHIDQQTEFKALVSLVLGWGHDPRSLWTPEGDQILSIARPVYMYQIKSSNWLLVLDIEEVRKVGGGTRSGAQNLH